MCKKREKESTAERKLVTVERSFCALLAHSIQGSRCIADMRRSLFFLLLLLLRPRGPDLSCLKTSVFGKRSAFADGKKAERAYRLVGICSPRSMQKCLLSLSRFRFILFVVRKRVYPWWHQQE